MTEFMAGLRPRRAGAGQPTEHQARRCDLDERLARLHPALIVLCQPTIANQPRETPFNDPPPRLDAETARARRSFHDLQVPAIALLPAPLRQLLPAVGRVCPDLLEPWHEQGESSEELASASGVGHIGRGNVNG